MATVETEGFDSDRSEQPTMATVTTDFLRGWDAVKQMGFKAGQLALLRDLTTRKFGRETSEELAWLLAGTPDEEQVGRVAAAIVDCEAADDFLARARGRG